MTRQILLVNEILEYFFKTLALVVGPFYAKYHVLKELETNRILAPLKTYLSFAVKMWVTL